MPAKPGSSANQRLTKKASSPATRRPRRAAKSVKYGHSAFEELEPQRPGILGRASTTSSFLPITQVHGQRLNAARGQESNALKLTMV
jgi:hypothetical protein